MSNKGDVMSIHFFPQGLWVSAADYKEVLERVLSALNKVCKQRKILCHLIRQRRAKNG